MTTRASSATQASGWHPALDDLEALLEPIAPGTPSKTLQRATESARVAAHLAECAACRDAHGELGTLVHRARALVPPLPPADLRARVLASRAAGVRPLIPLAPPLLADHEAEDVNAAGSRAPSEPIRSHGAATLAPVRGRRAGWRAGWGGGGRVLAAAAAAVAALVTGALLVPREDVQAGTMRGRLVLTPGLPGPGESVAVRYYPAALLSPEPWLSLRARVRRPQDGAYNGGRAVTALARLVRQADGSYAGTFTLPDSAVYAALAVEDSAATTVDDDGGRAWEVLARDASVGPTGAAARPSFAALDQRANDLMGRNWEEGFATTRRMVALYPDSLAGWQWLKSHQLWLGRADDDTVRAVHRAQLARFDARLRAAPHPPAADLGLISWYAAGLDSVAAGRWRARVVRDAPTNTFAVQWRLLDAFRALRATRDTARALAVLDTLWAEAPLERREQVAQGGASVAWATRDTALVRRWTDRELAAAREWTGSTVYAAPDVAGRFAADARLRAEGMQRLRVELARLSRLDPSARRLGETTGAQRRRYDAERRRVLATLGRALVADRAYRAGLDTLALATAGGWDVGVFRTARRASLAAGDTAGALALAAFIAADPRTPAAFADSVRPGAERALGTAGWAARRAAARREFVERMLAGAPPRALAGPVRLTDATGRPRALRDLAGGRVTVVAFTSRTCGPAIDDLPRLTAVRQRLERAGVRVLLVLEEPGPSPEAAAFLAKARVTGPVYFDARHEASRAFNQWATPNYFVLDADGRARFGATDSADEALARAEALRMAGAS